MTRASKHSPQRVRRPHPGFLFALLGTLGVALTAVQTIQPVREALGLDLVVGPATRTAVIEPVPDTVEPFETLRFDLLASARGVARAAAPAPARRLGAGTRRAVRLTPPAVELVSGGTVRFSAGAVQPVVAMPSPPSQRPDSARRGDTALGPVQYAKLDQALRRLAHGNPAAPVRVIVRTQPGQHQATARWLASEGREVHRLHHSLDGLTATLSVSDVAALSQDPSIASLSIDAVVTASGQGLEGTDGHVLRATLGLKTGGGLLEGGGDWNGDDVGVAIIDSGIEPSRDMDRQKRIVAFYDFTQDGASVAPYDDYGHGTHVAGLIGGDGDTADDAYQGVAPQAHLVGYKVLDASGAGYTSDVVAAIDHAVVFKDALDLHVVNLSLGHPIYERAADDPLVQAVERAVDAGLLVVVSAGNAGRDPETGVPGYGGISSPGNAPSAITVGAFDIRGTATRVDDAVTDYSSRGPTWYDAFTKPDLVAPGHKLVATVAKTGTLATSHPAEIVLAHGADDDGDTDTASDSDAASYMRMSGTSMSTAVVSGIVATMVEAHRDGKNDDDDPDLTQNAVKAILQFTAFPMEGVDTLTQGAGALNAAGAIRLAAAIDTASAPGEWWLTESLAPVDFIGGAALSWAQRLVWGDRIVWGDRLVWGDLSAFGRTGPTAGFNEVGD